MRYKHTFEGFMKTTVTIEKEPKSVYHVLKERIVTEQKLGETPNPNEMRYSWNFNFETNVGTHSNTEITEGSLRNVTGVSNGVWTSPEESLSFLATTVELRAVGNLLPGTKWYVSSDGGAIWEDMADEDGNSFNRLVTLSSPGAKLKIKIEFFRADTEIESLVLLYK